MHKINDFRITERGVTPEEVQIANNGNDFSGSHQIVQDRARLRLFQVSVLHNDVAFSNIYLSHFSPQQPPHHIALCNWF